MGAKPRRPSRASTTLAGRVQRLSSALAKRADPETKAWWERYLRGVIGFHGVRMATIRRELHRWIQSERARAPLTTPDERLLATMLMQQPLAEDKLAGILFIQEVLLPDGRIIWRRDLASMATLFDDGSIADWNTCDWFCVKVLGLMVVRDGEPCARSIAAWSRADNLWRRRASVVAFVNLAKHGEDHFPGFTDLLLESCQVLITSSERFAQTGAAWVIRELSLADPDRVATFLRSNLTSLSRESVRSATAKMSVHLKTELREEHEVTTSVNRTRFRSDVDAGTP